jgi:Flp pilus assembly protein TadD
MTVRAVVIPVIACLLTSCVRQVQDTSLRSPAAPPRPKHAAKPAPATAVEQAFDRHIRNALDAGEGDIQLAALRRRVAAKPDDIAARMDLAKAYIASGYRDIALEHYRVASARFPNSPELAVEVAKTLRMMALHAEAKVSLEQFTARSNDDASPDLLSWLAILQDEAGEYAAAEKNHRAAVEQRSNSDSLHNNLGYNLLLQGRNEEAAAEFRRALDIAPASTLARNNLGIAAASQPESARLHWQSVSDAATAHNNMAAVLMEKGNYVEARKELELALRYRNDHQAAWRNLNLVSELEGGGMEMRLPPAATAFWRRFLHIMIGESTQPSGGATVDAASK